MTEAAKPLTFMVRGFSTCFIGNSYKGLLSHIAVHEDEVTEAPGHDEEVENFVGAEELMLFIE